MVWVPTLEIHCIIILLYNDIRWWPPERRYIDEGYIRIPFPFEKHYTTMLVFAIEKRIVYDSQLLGYLNTWSAVKEYQQRHQQNPLELIEADLKAAWVIQHGKADPLAAACFARTHSSLVMDYFYSYISYS